MFVKTVTLNWHSGLDLVEKYNYLGWVGVYVRCYILFRKKKLRNHVD